MAANQIRAKRATFHRFFGFAMIVSIFILPVASWAEPTRATAENPAQVLFVGTFHFANPGLDTAKFETVDIMSDTKQTEVMEVVKRLAGFRPTKVALEATPEVADELKQSYQAYLAGDHELAVNERQQLGFRVAAGQELEQVHLIDHGGEFPMGAVIGYAQENDPGFLQRFQVAIKSVEDEMNRQQRELTIREILLELAKHEFVERGQSYYVDIAQVGGGDTFVGADLMTAWFDRNVRIFANLAAIAEPDDRILVLFGAGHSYQLRDLIRTAPNMQLVEVADYLGSDSP